MFSLCFDLYDGSKALFFDWYGLDALFVQLYAFYVVLWRWGHSDYVKYVDVLILLWCFLNEALCGWYNSEYMEQCECSHRGNMKLWRVACMVCTVTLMWWFHLDIVKYFMLCKDGGDSFHYGFSTWTVHISI